jgi:hypothetical protein
MATDILYLTTGRTYLLQPRVMDIQGRPLRLTNETAVSVISPNTHVRSRVLHPWPFPARVRLSRRAAKERTSPPIHTGMDDGADAVSLLRVGTAGRWQVWEKKRTMSPDVKTLGNAGTSQVDVAAVGAVSVQVNEKTSRPVYTSGTLYWMHWQGQKMCSERGWTGHLYAAETQ